MFVYFLRVGVRRLLNFFTPAYIYLISYYMARFQKDLSQKTGITFSLSISYDRFSPEVTFLAGDYDAGGDWQPQFRFAVRTDRTGILLYSLKFPAELRGQGYGRYCVKWLKTFCGRMGYQFIALGAYPEAEGFWHKMHFVSMPYTEWRMYWNV